MREEPVRLLVKDSGLNANVSLCTLSKLHYSGNKCIIKKDRRKQMLPIHFGSKKTNGAVLINLGKTGASEL